MAAPRTPAQLCGGERQARAAIAPRRGLPHCGRGTRKLGLPHLQLRAVLSQLSPVFQAGRRGRGAGLAGRPGGAGAPLDGSAGPAERPAACSEPGASDGTSELLSGHTLLFTFLVIY